MKVRFDKQKKGYILLTIIVSIGLLIILFINDKISETQLERKFQYGRFTIGEIISFEYSKSKEEINYSGKKINTADIGSIGQIISHTYYRITKFTYKIDGKSFITENSSEDYPNDLDKEPMSGDKYLAIYLPDKPEDCVLLFNYPIKDSADYIKYTEFFKTHSPRFHRFISKNDSIKP